MSAIAWWSVPALATLAAIAWTRWAARARRREGVAESIENYRRLQAVMAPKPATRPPGKGRRRPPTS
jgi:hypothetical protein